VIGLELILHDIVWAGLAALGFAMLFNVPRRTLPGCLVAGALGHVSRRILMSGGMSIESATLAAAVGIGFLAYYFARRWRTAATIFSVCGVIPMVPGRFAYSTMIGLLQLAELGTAAAPEILVEVSVNAVKTAMILGALAVGIAAPSLLFQRHRPIV
jgi:uncharacterized membrane protein YjjB (DUF3815 family)